MIVCIPFVVTPFVVEAFENTSCNMCVEIFYCDLVHYIDSPKEICVAAWKVALLRRKIRHCAGIHFAPIWKRGEIVGTVNAKPY